MTMMTMMTMDSPAHATCKPPLGSSSWKKNFQVSKPFFLSSTNLGLLPGCLQADKPRLWGRVSRSQSLEGEVGAGVEVLGWWELGLGLPEDTWRHQSRRWRRWGGGWGWWGRGRPASNCNREHSLGLTEGHVFPWKHSLLINALWWLSSSASWTNLCRRSRLYTDVSISIIIVSLKLDASMSKDRGPWFSPKGVGHSNGHNTQYTILKWTVLCNTVL